MNKIEPILNIQYNKSFYNKNNKSKTQNTIRNKVKKMFLYTSDIATKCYLEKHNHSLVQTQKNESGIVYVFENKSNLKFDSKLGLKIVYSNSMRF